MGSFCGKQKAPSLRFLYSLCCSDAGIGGPQPVHTRCPSGPRSPRVGDLVEFCNAPSVNRPAVHGTSEEVSPRSDIEIPGRDRTPGGIWSLHGKRVDATWHS